MDILTIKSLKISTKIGVHAWEQRIDQLLLIDLSLELDVQNCNENLEKTIDYSILCETVTEYVSTRSFQLIETVANEIARLIQKQFNINKLSVSVSKPHAIKNADNVQITISRDYSLSC